MKTPVLTRRPKRVTYKGIIEAVFLDGYLFRFKMDWGGTFTCINIFDQPVMEGLICYVLIEDVYKGQQFYKDGEIREYSKSGWYALSIISA